MQTVKKILVVFGTRPEAIKMAPLVKKFQGYPDHFNTIVCVTAQHRQLLDQVLHLFDIRPDYDLDIMQPDQDLYDLTSRILMKMRDVIKETEPALLLVHGDTTTTMAASLAAFYQQIPVGHVEAGLRTHNIYSPWPEEMNRQITGRIATYHFSPTLLNKSHLIREGIGEDKIFVTGNTIMDALRMVTDKIRNSEIIREQTVACLSNYGIPTALIHSWSSGERKMILITGHRRENFGEGFIHICEAIRSLAEIHAGFDFVYPLHLNPNVRKSVNAVFYQGDFQSPGHNIFLTEPLDYLPFVYLMNLSYLVLTDSGGIQEEAPGLGKPVIVMRDTTERTEALEAGTVILTGADKNKIMEAVNMLIHDKMKYEAMKSAVNPYGDGHACERILNIILNGFKV